MGLVRSNAPHIVILGGGYAGVLAALRLGTGGARRITLVNASPHFVERIRLHQLGAGQRLPRRPLADLLGPAGIELQLGRVVAIEPAAQRVRIELPDRSTLRLGWDYLIYALGSGPATGGLGGHVHTVASEAGAERLAERLVGLDPGEHVAVIGGGLTGIETASELAESHPHLRVTLLTDGELGPALSAGGRRYLRETLESLGVAIREGVPVRAAEPGALHLPGETMAVAAAVLCGGFTPSAIAADSGLPVDGHGRLRVDAALRVPGHDAIFGCGDGVAAGLRMACATAMPMAAHAADNLRALLAGRPLRPLGFAYAFQCLSLGRRRGLVQRVAPDDSARTFIVTGRIAARMKEAVCRFTTLALDIERRFQRTYTWPGRRRLPAPGAPALSS